MQSSKGNDGSDVPVVVGRRSARLSVIVPVTIRGVAPNGKPFKENTWTICLNKQGAKLFAFHEPSVGDEITVENPVLGRAVKARVVRVCEKRFPEDPYEIALELTDAQNVWGVKFPPEDWKKDRPAPPARGPEKAAETPSASPGLNAASPASAGSEEKDRSAAAPGTTSTEPNGSAEGFDQLNLAITGLSRFAQQTDEGADKPAPPGERKLAGPSGQAELLSPAYYQETLRLLEDKVRKVHALEKDLDSLLSRLENSRAEAEVSLIKIRDAGQKGSEEAEKVRRDIQEASQQAFESSLEKAKLRIQDDIASASSAVINRAQNRFQDEISTMIEGQLKVAETRLASLKEDGLSKYSSELQATQAELTEKGKDEIRSLTEGHAASFSERLKKLAEEISPPVCGQVEKSLEAAAQSVAGRHLILLKEEALRAHGELETSIRQKLDKAQQEVQEQVTKAEEKLRLLRDQGAETARAGIAQCSADALEAFKTVATESIAQFETGREKLELNCKEVLENFRKQLAELSTKALDGSRNYMEAQFQGLKKEVEEALRQAQEKNFQEASDRLRKLNEETLRSSSGHLQKTTEGELQRINEELATTEKKTVEEVRKQLVAASQSTLESLLLDVKATSEEYRAHLRKVFLEFQERGEGDLVAHLQSTFEKQRETVGAQLQKEAAAASERISAEIKSLAERLVQEASDTMYKQVGVAAVAMKGWTDDARAQVEGCFQKSLADQLQQMGEFSRASLSAYRSELRTLAADFSSRLENASRLLQGLEKGRTNPVPEALPPGAESPLPKPAPARPVPPTEQGLARQEQVLKASQEAAKGPVAGPPGEPHAPSMSAIKPKA